MREMGDLLRGWKPIDKTCWCTPCTGHRDKAGVWAHWERSDGFTVCGEFHKPEDFPLPPRRRPSQRAT